MAKKEQKPSKTTLGYYPFGLKHIGYNGVVSSTNPAQDYKYNGKELNDELGLDWYDYGARNYDASLGRWMNLDALAGKWHEFSPYNYTLNNPVFFVDPDGNDIDVSRTTDDDGNVTITITLTGKIVNESGTDYTNEELQRFADRFAEGFAESFSGEGENISFKGVANLSVADNDNPLTKTDHAIRIVDKGKIPDGKGGFERGSVFGKAEYGENDVYISQHILDNKEATEGPYKGYGKTKEGKPTLERTGPHEIGHSAYLVGHPDPGTLNGNLMHQTRRIRAGKKLTEQQILQIEKAFNDGKLNKGQKINRSPSKKNIRS